MTIGILPCAGRAERFNGLPKYLLPCPGGFLLERHVNAMRAAGCSDVHVLTSPENKSSLMDICDAKIAVVNKYETMTQTVLNTLAAGFGKDEPVIFGMPDTYWSDFDRPFHSPYYTFTHFHSSADVVLMCWQVRWKQWQRGGMCDLEVGGRVMRIVDKPERSDTPWIWGAMCWKPHIWPYFKPEDPHVGYGIQRAIEDGAYVHAIVSWNGDYYDCGDRDSYFEMIRDVTCEPE